MHIFDQNSIYRNQRGGIYSTHELVGGVFRHITRDKKLSSEAYTYQCSNLQYVDH